VLTLVIFFVFRIPAIWSGVDYSKAPRKEGKKSSGAAAIVAGALCLTIQFFMAPTHTWDGVNYADAFNTTMTIVGSGLVLLGIGLILSSVLVLAPMKRKVDTLR
jgi:predicted phage tail protein